MRASSIRLTTAFVFLLTAMSASAQTPAGVTPEARAIIERHLAAAGATDPAAVTSMRASGTLAMPAQGITGTVQIIAARPDKTLLKAEIAGIGSLESGFDGERGWSVDPIMGPSLLTGKQLDQAKFDASFDGPFHDLSRFTSLAAAGTEEFDGRQAHRVNAINMSGDKSAEYFDAATGLHAGSVSTRETPMGAIDVTSIVRDYRKAGGALQAHQLVQRMMGVEQIITLDTFEFNVATAGTFAMPPAVKALVK
ncbi:MAG: hypothetical protein M3Q55_13995 [Acidobacteriota bacterium]|nr:hypothetical protein [Acidobacteriota bacterium]